MKLPSPRLLAFIAGLCVTVPLYATETITYSYDAKGRLAQVNHSGSVNNGAQTVYQFDATDNRNKVTITGAVQKIVVVPINGLTVIPIPDR